MQDYQYALQVEAHYRELVHKFLFILYAVDFGIGVAWRKQENESDYDADVIQRRKKKEKKIVGRIHTSSN